MWWRRLQCRHTVQFVCATLRNRLRCLICVIIIIFLLMRAVLMLFGFLVSISFCKNARFLAVPFSMIEYRVLECVHDIYQLSFGLAELFALFWFSRSLLIPLETCLLISLNRIFTLSNGSLLVTSSNFGWECAPGS